MARAPSNVIPLKASPRLLSWVAAMAEALTLPLLLVRDDQRLVEANMAGHSELRRARWLALDGDRVVAAGAARGPSFDAAMLRALQQRMRVEWPIARDEPSPSDDARIVIAPVVAGEGGPMLMLVLPAEAAMDEACRLFAYQYGLSEGEHAVLYALCQGQAPRQIADARGVGLSTVRAQLASVKRKCGEDSLGTLLPRIRALPPVTPRGE